MWYSDSGERLGTYNQHKGAVWDLDPSFDSKYLLTACADGMARLFETTTGSFLARMPHKGAVRACAFGEGNNQFVTAADPFHTRALGTISIYDFPSNRILSEQPTANCNKYIYIIFFILY